MVLEMGSTSGIYMMMITDDGDDIVVILAAFTQDNDKPLCLAAHVYFSPHHLRGSSADRLKTLPHDWKWV